MKYNRKFIYLEEIKYKTFFWSILIFSLSLSFSPVRLGRSRQAALWGSLGNEAQRVTRGRR